MSDPDKKNPTGGPHNAWCKTFTPNSPVIGHMLNTKGIQHIVSMRPKGELVPNETDFLPFIEIYASLSPAKMEMLKYHIEPVLFCLKHDNAAHVAVHDLKEDDVSPDELKRYREDMRYIIEGSLDTDDAFKQAVAHCGMPRDFMMDMVMWSFLMQSRAPIQGMDI